jgi:ribosomal protein S18 acetylase RimI-like enzyme
MAETIRTVSDTDDLVAITELVHAAYAPHAAAGLRYWGTHQSIEDTSRRLASGTGFVVIDGGQYVGVVILRPPQPDSSVPLYREPDVWSLSQFCVAPERKGSGLGRKLHDFALSRASAEGARYIALDTAEPARALIAMYERWGYSIVGSCDWRPHTNYRSVLMKRPIALEVERGT